MLQKNFLKVWRVKHLQIKRLQILWIWSCLLHPGLILIFSSKRPYRIDPQTQNRAKMEILLFGSIRTVRTWVAVVKVVAVIWILTLQMKRPRLERRENGQVYLGQRQARNQGNAKFVEISLVIEYYLSRNYVLLQIHLSKHDQLNRSLSELRCELSILLEGVSTIRAW